MTHMVNTKIYTLFDCALVNYIYIPFITVYNIV